MSHTGSSYTYSFPGSATFSQTFPFGGDIFSPTGLDQMMSAIPDNTANLIQAVDVRNAVFTLWKRTDELHDQTIADFNYSSQTPSTATIGGWPKGTTFSGQSLGQIFDGLFYPYVGPGVTISLSSNTKYKGQSNNISISWSIEKNSNSIQSFRINSTTFSITGLSQSGSTVFSVPKWTDTTFTASVFDGVQTQSVISTFEWSEKFWWGTSEYFSNTWSNMQIQLLPNNTNLRELEIILDGKSHPRINGSGDYLVFAFPSYFGQPVFWVNGLINNAFTKIHGSGSIYYSSVTYSIGSYTQSYDIWISNTQQYSTIDYLKITT
jgi:hypothetical protein